MSDTHDPEIKKALEKFQKTRERPDLKAFIQKLNTYYSTRLSTKEIIRLSEMDIKIIDQIEKGSYVSAVNTIRKICTRDLYSFATKFVYFVSGEKSPIFDSYIGMALTRDFELFYEIMTNLSKERKMNLHDLDDFIMNKGKIIVEKEKKRKDANTV